MTVSAVNDEVGILIPSVGGRQGRDRLGNLRGRVKIIDVTGNDISREDRAGDLHQARRFEPRVSGDLLGWQLDGQHHPASRCGGIGLQQPQ